MGHIRTYMGHIRAYMGFIRTVGRICSRLAHILKSQRQSTCPIQRRCRGPFWESPGPEWHSETSATGHMSYTPPLQRALLSISPSDILDGHLGHIWDILGHIRDMLGHIWDILCGSRVTFLWQFWNVDALRYLGYRAAIESTFANFCCLSWRRVAGRSCDTHTERERERERERDKLGTISVTWQFWKVCSRVLGLL
jgi:hypothetical protein